MVTCKNIKLREVSKATNTAHTQKYVWKHQGNDLGYRNNFVDIWLIRSQATEQCYVEGSETKWCLVGVASSLRYSPLINESLCIHASTRILMEINIMVSVYSEKEYASGVYDQHNRLHTAKPSKCGNTLKLLSTILRRKLCRKPRSARQEK